MAAKIKEIIIFNSDNEVIEVKTFDRDPPDANNKRRGFTIKINPKLGDNTEASRIETKFPETFLE